MLPKVSVIIPVYNTERYIHQCLDSVFSQTYVNFEVVLVDDGSTDQSGVICDEYASRDQRCVVIHKQNEGVVKARMEAVKHSSGELITFVDSDDYVEDCYLEILVKNMIEQDADLVCGGKDRVKEGHVIPIKYLIGTYQEDDIRNFISQDLLFSRKLNGFVMPPGLSPMLYRRQHVLEGLGQGLGLWYGEDIVALIYILLRTRKLIMLPDVIYHYVAHQGETVMKYDLTLWENQAIAIQRIERICQLSHLSLIGVRERIWHIFSINVERMFDLGMSSNNICRHLSKAREMTFYSDFFKAPFVSKDHSVRANIGYVLMKNKLFLLFLLWKRIGVYYKKKG